MKKPYEKTLPQRGGLMCICRYNLALYYSTTMGLYLGTSAFMMLHPMR